ncbi:MAG: hydrogenase maturation protease [Frankia sp.]|nr:hydrogenase maturation protease [Frankia sp.]
MCYALPDSGHHPRLTVVGVGNPYRGDDAAGLLVVRELAAAGRCPLGTEIVEYPGEPTGLLSVWADAGAAWLVDAAIFDAPPGTVHRAVITEDTREDLDKLLPPGLRASSTHALGVADALRLASTLSQLPPRLVIYAIRAADLTTGAAISPPVAAAVREVVPLIESELREHARPNSPRA